MSRRRSLEDRIEDRHLQEAIELSMKDSRQSNNNNNEQSNNVSGDHTAEEPMNIANAAPGIGSP